MFQQYYGFLIKENDISKAVRHAAMEVHRTLGGPIPLESVYEKALALELDQTGLSVKRQLVVPIQHKGPASQHR